MFKKLTVTAHLLCTSVVGLWAQAPPVTLQWTALQPNGSSGIAPARISVDQGVTYWMVGDEAGFWTTGDGIIRRYDTNGMALTGNAPESTYIGCGGSLDHPVDFHVRNDSIWGIARWQYLGGSPQDILFCAQSPSSSWTPDASVNGDLLADGVSAMQLTADRRYLCAWHEVSFGQADGRVIAFDMSDNVLWDISLPLGAFGSIHALAASGDSLAVAAFPELHWLGNATGVHTSSTTLYSGAAGRGALAIVGGDLYWAAEADGTVHYGKRNATGASVWSGSAPGITVNAIAIDAQERLWIGGNGTNEGKLIKVEADGTLDAAYSYGATLTDLDFSNGRLSWTGQLAIGDPSTYLVNTTPQP